MFKKRKKGPLVYQNAFLVLFKKAMWLLTLLHFAFVVRNSKHRVGNYIPEFEYIMDKCLYLNKALHIIIDNDSNKSDNSTVDSKPEPKKNEGKAKPLGPAQGSTPMHREPQLSYLSKNGNRNLVEKNQGLANLFVIIFVTYNAR